MRSQSSVGVLSEPATTPHIHTATTEQLKRIRNLLLHVTNPEAFKLREPSQAASAERGALEALIIKCEIGKDINDIESLCASLSQDNAYELLLLDYIDQSKAFHRSPERGKTSTLDTIAGLICERFDSRSDSPTITKSIITLVKKLSRDQSYSVLGSTCIGNGFFNTTFHDIVKMIPDKVKSDEESVSAKNTFVLELLSALTKDILPSQAANLLTARAYNGGLAAGSAPAWSYKGTALKALCQATREILKGHQEPQEHLSIIFGIIQKGIESSERVSRKFGVTEPDSNSGFITILDGYYERIENPKYPQSESIDLLTSYIELGLPFRTRGAINAVIEVADRASKLLDETKKKIGKIGVSEEKIVEYKSRLESFQSTLTSCDKLFTSCLAKLDNSYCGKEKSESEKKIKKSLQKLHELDVSTQFSQGGAPREAGPAETTGSSPRTSTEATSATQVAHVHRATMR